MPHRLKMAFCERGSPASSDDNPHVPCCVVANRYDIHQVSHLVPLHLESPPPQPSLKKNGYQPRILYSRPGQPLHHWLLALARGFGSRMRLRLSREDPGDQVVEVLEDQIAAGHEYQGDSSDEEDTEAETQGHRH